MTEDQRLTEMLKSVSKFCNESKMTHLGTRGIMQTLYTYIVGRAVTGGMSKDEFKAGLVAMVDPLWEGWQESVAAGKTAPIVYEGRCNMCGHEAH